MLIYFNNIMYAGQKNLHNISVGILALCSLKINLNDFVNRVNVQKVIKVTFNCGNVEEFI